MEAAQKIELEFTEEEKTLRQMLEKHCAAKNVSVSDYIKELVKRDLAWGQFMRPRKHGGKPDASDS